MTEVKLLDFSYNSPHGTSAVIANLLQNLPENDYRIDSMLRKIPNEYVYHKFKGKHNQYDSYGKTDVPHITIATGLNRYQLFKIMDYLESNIEPYIITVGNVISYRPKDKPYDVLALEVKSPESVVIHKWIRDNFGANKQNGRENLRPHITLAYIQKDTCKELEGHSHLTGSKILIRNLEFKDMYNHSYMIKLGSRIKYDSKGHNIPASLAG
jgi:hypothetical protein